MNLKDRITALEIDAKILERIASQYHETSNERAALKRAAIALWYVLTSDYEAFSADRELSAKLLRLSACSLPAVLIVRSSGRLHDRHRHQDPCAGRELRIMWIAQLGPDLVGTPAAIRAHGTSQSP